MPDLDQLLVADVDRCAAADGDPCSLDAAFDRALRTIRRRRLSAAALSAVAVAAVGTGSILLMHPSGHDDPGMRFAAYDRVMGTAPDDSSITYVIGPKDEYTADCDIVPGTIVQLYPAEPDPSAPGGTALGAVEVSGNIPPMSPAHPQAPAVQFEYDLGDDMPPVRYYFFECATG